MVGYHKALEFNGAICARARKGSPALTSDSVWVPAWRRRRQHQTDLMLQQQQILQMGQRKENTQTCRCRLASKPGASQSHILTKNPRP